jgi:transcriptional regulator with XRE-family HTH domain
VSSDTTASLTHVPTAKTHTAKPFATELTRICEKQGISLRELAREVGVDHSIIRKMVDGTRPIQPDLIADISISLDLPEDYFPEVRLARIMDALIDRPKLADEIYFKRLRRPGGGRA